MGGSMQEPDQCFAITGITDCQEYVIIAMLYINPLTAGAAYIRVLFFY